MNFSAPAAAAPVQRNSSSTKDSATAVPTVGVADAVAAVQVSTTQAAADVSSSSLWKQWAEGDEDGDWWTDSSDWEEEEEEEEGHWPDMVGVEAAGQLGLPSGAAAVSQAAAAHAGSSAGSAASTAAGSVQASHSQMSIEAMASGGASEPTRAAASMLAAGPAAAEIAGCGAAAAATVAPEPTAFLTAWQQLHGSQPMLPETMGLAMPSDNMAAAQSQSQQQQQDSMLAAADAVAPVQLTVSSYGSSKKGSVSGNSSSWTAAAGDADTVHGSSSSMQGVLSRGQQQGLGLTPAVIAAAEAAHVHMVSELQEAVAGRSLVSAAASTGQCVLINGSSMDVHKQRPEIGGTGGVQVTSAASTAAGAPTGDCRSSTAATVLVVESESCECLVNNPLLAKAAIARAAAAVTKHSRTIRSADRAVAAAGGEEPPAAAVTDIIYALRTAATQSVKQLQPGGSHYWRGKKAWKHSKQTANSSSSSTAAAAAEAAAKASDPDAAVAAAIAAAEAAGRGCSAADLHAAWLMQRLGAGLLRVTVRRPAVSIEALEQALADHGVEPLPGGCSQGLLMVPRCCLWW
jgi:hypothetical protein